MKYLFSFLLLVSLVHLGYSQEDQIITTEGDTLMCEITRITDEFIHFSVFDSKTGIILMRSRLPLSGVHSYTQSKVTPSGEGQESKQPTSSETDNLPVEPDFSDDLSPPNYRLSFNGGYTFQWGGYEGLPDSYRRQVQSLWHVGGELHYFTSENFGLGFKYNRIATQANEDFSPQLGRLFGFNALRDEKIRFNYIGLSFMGRQFLYDNEIVYYFLSLGMIEYRTDLLGDGVPYFQQGETFGVNLGFKYDFLFNKSIGVGIGIEINLSSLSQINDNGTVRPADFNISRVDLTAGIRIFN
ncbi:MAG: hypothetical protein AAGA66_17370 [Bacteroidota bacterium]